MINEEFVEKFISKNLWIIEEDIKILERQYYLETGGIIDILAKDKEGNFLIVEVKKGEANRKTLGQILEYISSFMKEKNIERNQIRGIVITKTAPQKMKKTFKLAYVELVLFEELFSKTFFGKKIKRIKKMEEVIQEQKKKLEDYKKLLDIKKLEKEKIDEFFGRKKKEGLTFREFVKVESALSKVEDLKLKCKRFYEKNKDKVMDIILFGSTARGKELPEDFDICLILKDSSLKGLAKKFRKDLPRKVHVSVLSTSNLFSSSLWQTILREGVSIISERAVSELLGFRSYALYWYNLENLNQTDKVRFYYALKGRKGEEGILQKLNGKHLGKGVIMVPLEGDDEMQEFFLDWEISFHRREILVGK